MPEIDLAVLPGTLEGSLADSHLATTAYTAPDRSARVMPANPFSSHRNGRHALSVGARVHSFQTRVPTDALPHANGSPSAVESPGRVIESPGNCSPRKDRVSPSPASLEANV